MTPEPTAFNQVLIAIIAMIGTVLTSAISAYVLVRTGRIQQAVKETHDLVDGVNEKLSAAQIGQAKAEGITAGEAAQRDRQAAPEQDVGERTAAATERTADNTEKEGS